MALIESKLKIISNIKSYIEYYVVQYLYENGNSCLLFVNKSLHKNNVTLMVQQVCKFWECTKMCISFTIKLQGIYMHIYMCVCLCMCEN